MDEALQEVVRANQPSSHWKHRQSLLELDAHSLPFVKVIRWCIVAVCVCVIGRVSVCCEQGGGGGRVLEQHSETFCCHRWVLTCRGQPLCTSLIQYVDFERIALSPFDPDSVTLSA